MELKDVNINQRARPIRHARLFKGVEGSKEFSQEGRVADNNNNNNYAAPRLWFWFLLGPFGRQFIWPIRPSWNRLMAGKHDFGHFCWVGSFSATPTGAN
jgi:hypothetical protein